MAWGEMRQFTANDYMGSDEPIRLSFTAYFFKRVRDIILDKKDISKTPTWSRNDEK
jgi:hypothetical protein